MGRIYLDRTGGGNTGPSAAAGGYFFCGDGGDYLYVVSPNLEKSDSTPKIVIADATLNEFSWTNLNSGSHSLRFRVNGTIITTENFSGATGIHVMNTPLVVNKGDELSVEELNGNMTKVLIMLF